MKYLDPQQIIDWKERHGKPRRGSDLVFQVSELTKAWEVRPQGETFIGDHVVVRLATKRNEPAVFGEGEPPEGMFDPERMRHSDFRVISPIDIEKWNAGKWRAVFFMTVDGNGPPPVMCLAFLNADPGRAIFESWQALYGLDDPDGNVRIAFIRRVRSSNPHAYAVIVGPDPNKLGEQSGNFFEFVSRYQVMTPDSSENLDRFLKSYEDHERFLIGPAYMPSLTAAPRPMLETVLGKYSLVVREA
ncbi:hypothetical protein [Rhizobium leguminosarum]|uniref:hypothetical protein n=1 Tax=Rhizobium leguminosarum TaxID=384 RepID=UPI00103C6C11|nr:hypothetical protein [Rhizobium leguminosarum]TBY81729.1 hypothetical protein E0H32_15725 [Rhizobium leguminosarum bv. viciae]